MNNSVLSMAQAPRKKYAFFDKGRGIPEMDENTTSPVTSASESSTRQSSPQLLEEQYLNSAAEEYQFPSNYASDYSSSLSPSSGYSSLSPYNSYNYSMEVSARSSQLLKTPEFAEASSYPQLMSSTPSCSSDRSSSLQYEEDGEHDGQQPKKRKRAQKCRMCANHNMETDVKGHKWLCPFRDCNCDDCHVTRRTQFWMKERQKLTRYQQGEKIQVEHEPRQRRRSVTADSMEFPRRDELVKETANIIEDDLFQQINEVCRPKSSFKR